METPIEPSFSDFYERWIRKLEELLQLLVGVGHREAEAEAEHALSLVNRVTAHHKEYYTKKWAAAKECVLGFFVPIWLTPLENAYMWITGWKPSMAFKLVDSLRQQSHHHHQLAGVSEEQLKKIESLRLKIKNEEAKVEREMERQQVAIADPRMVELAKLVGRSKSITDCTTESKVDGLVQVAMKNVMGGLLKVMKMADCVRLKTLKGVLEILNPEQSVNFLAATSIVQIQMRKWGKLREDNNGGNGLCMHKELAH